MTSMSSIYNKGPYSQSYGFSSSHVRRWKLDHKEGWAPKNWCFWIVVEQFKEIREDSRGPWTARRSNQSILKEINPKYSLEGQGLMLKLKLQHFGHVMWRAGSLEKTLVLAGRGWGQEEKGMRDEMRWMASWT